MNKKKGRAKFKNFRILLDNGCIATIVMVRLITKLNPKEDYVMQCHTQAINITTNLKVKIYFTLPESSEMEIVEFSCG